jgi:1-acyl-sn-glycerol-3-phosphate acyltransferase
MIPADKSRWITRFLARDAERRIRSHFSVVRIHGLEALSSELARGPVVVVSNHTSWWDPIVLQWVCARVLHDVDAYALMDVKNLTRLPFFRKVGAFGVDLEDPTDGMRAMRYAAKLLDRPRRLVWVFPQGQEVPITKPLEFRSGAAVIARLARAPVVPAALRYEIGGEPQPHLWLSFGPVAAKGGKDCEAGRVAQESAVAVEMQRLQDAIHSANDAGFTRVHERGPSAIFRFAEAALAWLTRMPSGRGQLVSEKSSPRDPKLAAAPSDAR